MNIVKFIPIVLFIALSAAGCSGGHLIINEDKSRRLCRCFPLPNCVSSESWIFYNQAASFELAMPADKAWSLIREGVLGIPRTEIVEEMPGYIHAKCRSLIFRFVDNLELLLNEDGKTVSVRSSSAIAIFDFEVNYMRVRSLRHDLAEKGIIKP